MKQRSRKKIWAVASALALVVALLPAVGLGGSATDAYDNDDDVYSIDLDVEYASETPHEHSYTNGICQNDGCDAKCDGMHTGWLSVNPAGGPISDGHYVVPDGGVTGNLTVSGEVWLCLNGKTITGTGSGSVITVESSATLHLCDCQGTGTITGGSAQYGGGVNVNSNTSYPATFNMYGGNITENEAYQATGRAYGGGVCVGEGGTFNMYGGTISDNEAVLYIDVGQWSDFAEPSLGGGVNVRKNAAFNMFGGTISGNEATLGGGVYVSSPTTDYDQGGKFTMSGADCTISNNTAAGYALNNSYSFETLFNGGGGVYLESSSSWLSDSVEFAEFTMESGTISGNHAPDGNGGYYESIGYGGGVYVGSRSKFTMESGKIIGDGDPNVLEAGNRGGGVYVEGTFIMNDGQIDQNNAGHSGGGVYLEGATFTMTTGEITNNTATDFGSGGGVCLDEYYIDENNSRGSSFTMDDGTIANNGGIWNGGGVNVGSNCTFTMNGGTIKNNATDDTYGYGGGVNNYGTFTMNGYSTVEGNHAYADKYNGDCGGVYNAGTFTMNDYASVKDNVAHGCDGGGVLNANGKLIMNDNAAITGNKVVLYTYGDITIGGDGGGVWSSAYDSTELVYDEYTWDLIGVIPHYGFGSITMRDNASVTNNSVEYYESTYDYQDENYNNYTSDCYYGSGGGICIPYGGGYGPDDNYDGIYESLQYIYPAVLDIQGNVKINGNTVIVDGVPRSNDIVLGRDADYSYDALPTNIRITAPLTWNADNYPIYVEHADFHKGYCIGLSDGFIARNLEGDPATETPLSGWEEFMSGEDFSDYFVEEHEDFRLTYDAEGKISAGESGLYFSGKKTVTFDVDVGELVDDEDSEIEVFRGDVITAPAAVYADHAVEGWYKWEYDENAGTWDFGAKWDFDDAVIDTMTLKAKWQQLDYTVTFMPNDGEGQQVTQGFLSGVEQALFTNLFTHAEGYEFIGWNTEPDGSGTAYPAGEATNITEDLTLYAQWEAPAPETCTITFYPNGGEGTMEPQIVNKGEATDLHMNTFTRDGYTSDGWNTEPDGSGIPYYDGEHVACSEDLDLYAQWIEDEDETYSVYIRAIDENGASVPQGCLFFTIEIPDESGIWDSQRTDENGELQFDYLTPSDQSYTLHCPLGNAYYVSAHPTIQFTLDENGDVTLADDYGDSFDVNDEGQIVAKVVYTVYTITFLDDDGETVLLTKKLPHNVGVSIDNCTPDPKEGYTFLRWQGEDGSEWSDGIHTGLKSLKFTAVWEKNAEAPEKPEPPVYTGGSEAVPSAPLKDTDGDGIPDVIDPDDDNDGIPDFEDPDPLLPSVVDLGEEKFRDVDQNAWYAEYVDYVVDNGIMQGISEALFDPHGETSRAQIIMSLWRMEGEPLVNHPLYFSDVSENAWYADALRWMNSEGIVLGYGDGRYGTDDPVTREQIATILWRYARFKGVDTSSGESVSLLKFSDAKKISAYAISALQWACGEALIEGTVDESGAIVLDPQGSATRAQVAAILMRFCENVL